jgi:hypothetical protein
VKKNSPIISIIIVHYHVKKELFACLRSIYKSGLTILFEIIVIDNDETPTIEKELKRTFPAVQYHKNINNGWGGGTNVGVSFSKGKYLYFLNPDTLLYPKAINILYTFFQNHKNTGIVSSLLLGHNDKPYPLQGTKELTPLRAIFVYSFLNKLFPKNFITKKFWSLDWKKTKIKQVDIAPLSAALVQKDVFLRAGKFDENFFLYFEEYDLGKRINALGLQNFIVPESKVIHSWGVSTKKRNDIKKIFESSRFTFFKKYFGLFTAVSVEAFLRINKTFILLVFIFGLGAFLRLFQINSLMPFIGDQGWFYLSARDMILTGNFPLVGIASSHPWLHQGALWTYLLAFSFKVLGFNPLSGAYLSIVLDIAAIFAIYKVSSRMFSKRLGLIAALLYATSPLVIMNSRMPYHTSPIPLFSIIFIYFLYKWINGNKYYFPLIIATLAILYNFEIATFVFSIAFVILIIYGFLKNKSWISGILSLKLFFISCIAFAIPMLPMLLYDLNNGYPQTLGFVAWVGYKILGFFGLFPTHNSSPTWTEMISFLGTQISQLFFAYSATISWLIVSVSFVYSFLQVKKEKLTSSIGIILIINSVIFLGLMATRTPSLAYMPMLFAPAIILVAYFIDKIMTIKRVFYFSLFVFVSFTISNCFFIIKNNYFIEKNHGFGPSLTARINTAEKIITLAKGRKYNLIGSGEGSQFESYTMNYEYLTWFFGNPPVKEKTTLQIVVSDDIISPLLYER